MIRATLKQSLLVDFNSKPIFGVSFFAFKWLIAIQMQKAIKHIVCKESIWIYAAVAVVNTEDHKTLYYFAFIPQAAEAAFT